MRHSPKLLRDFAAVAGLAGLVLAAAADEPVVDLDGSTLAILPVEVHTTDRQAPALAARVDDELARYLATVDGLHVVPGQRKLSPSGVEMTPAEIARELGAGSVLTSILDTDPQFFILELRHVDAATGDTWSFSSSLIGVRHDVERRTFDAEEKLAASMTRLTESIRIQLLPGFPPTQDESLASARRVFLDTSRSDQERLRALQALTPARASAYPPSYVDGGAALRGEIAMVAARLAAESDDVGVRSRIWYTMAGVGDPQLIEPLLKALSDDSHFDVRARAARTLVDYIDQPRVRDALDRARQNDSSERVREAARSVLYSAN